MTLLKNHSRPGISPTCLQLGNREYFQVAGVRCNLRLSSLTQPLVARGVSGLGDLSARFTHRLTRRYGIDVYLASDVNIKDMQC